MEAGAPTESRFDVCELEARFAVLERLGRGVWLPAIVNSQGLPVARLRALVIARERLIAGEDALRTGDEWPEPDLVAAFSASLASLPIGPVAKSNEEVCDLVLRSLLWHLDQVLLLSERMPREAAIAELARAFVDDWQARFEDLREVFTVFETLELGAEFARWSDLRGLLRSDGWQQVLAARERIAQMPGLSELIQRLGRAQCEQMQEIATTSRPAVPQSVPRRWVARSREVDLPGAPLETEGVRRSGDFERMLSSELLQWRRRRRFLAARRAEQTLLGYQHRHFGIETVLVRSPARTRDTRQARIARRRTGPMILCVDTSSSMNGAPERVAKALVLEAVRVASAQRRDCLLFAFSGPGELVTLEFGAGADAVFTLAGFLGHSFHGGTDLCDPLEAALRALETERWESADLVIASDGEFGAPPQLRDRLGRARDELGLRVQGVLVSDRETIGMSELCGDVFWVRDWRRFGVHGQIEPPVHARNLTELYFPGAFARGPRSAGAGGGQGG